MGFYDDYLRSAEWRAVRGFMLDWAAGRCQECASDENLEVHHRTYDRLGSERVPEDLEVLCSPCHSLLHGRAPRAMPVLSSEPSALEKRQAYQYDIALREALGTAIAEGDGGLADEVRVAMRQRPGGSGKVRWSRRRRKREAQARRRSDQRAEPSAAWERTA